jgi:hypothetical protein
MPNKWNLIFLDFKYAKFDATHQQYPDVSKLTMDPKYCCRFLLLPAGCQCPDEFSVSKFHNRQSKKKNQQPRSSQMEKAIITIAFRYIIEMILENDLQSIRGGCDVKALGTQTLGAMERMMKEMFAKLQSETPLTSDEDKKLLSNITMSIYSSANDGDLDVVKIGEIDQEQMRSTTTVKMAKRFLYIGAVEVGGICRKQKTNQNLLFLPGDTLVLAETRPVNKRTFVGRQRKTTMGRLLH